MRYSLAAFLLFVQACEEPGPAGIDAGIRTDAAARACEDCPAQTHCVVDRCVPDCPCPAGESCDEQGQCHPICSQDRDCETGSICMAGHCHLGCEHDGVCAPEEICEDFRCSPAQCAAIDDCGSGQVCENRRCLDRDEVACESEADCGRDWRCSSYGLCFTGDCLVHGDCPEEARCNQGQCVPLLPPSEVGVLFERRYLPPITDHLVQLHEYDQFHGFGLGAALFDFDGDLDLDLFLGSEQKGEGLVDDWPACIYENSSVPGTTRFRPVDRFCEGQFGTVSNAFGLDVDDDGFHELVTLNTGVFKLWRFHPEVSVIDLSSQLAEDAPGRICEAGAVASMDLDLDGRADLVIGCQAPLFIEGLNGEPINIPEPGRAGEDNQVHSPQLRNLTFLQGPDGSFRFTQDPEIIDRRGDNYGLEDDGSSLSIGQIDVDGDGLLDLVVVNDTIDWPFEGMDGVTAPAGVYFRCPPTESCTWSWRGLAPGVEAFSGFMGVGNLHVEGRGDHLYVANTGANYCSYYQGRSPRNIALELAIDLEGQEIPLYAWGVIVEDFDRNGWDDLYIAHGPPPMLFGRHPANFVAQADAVVLQVNRGDFAVFDAEEVGLSPPNLMDTANQDRGYSSRGAVKADLDFDGFVELLTLPMEGVLRIHGEVPSTAEVSPRCTLVPRNRYVPSFGFGYAVAGPTGDAWRRRDMQGQMRFGASPFVLSTVSRGRLRFPSGAIVEFDCENGPGPVVVEEPEWIRIIDREGVTKLRLDTVWLGQALPHLTVYFEGPEGLREVAPFHDGVGWDLRPQADETRMMFKLNGKWISRWFATR